MQKLYTKLLLLFFLVNIFTIQAQVVYEDQIVKTTSMPFKLESEKGVFKYLKGGTVVPDLSQGLISFGLDIGFNFKFGGKDYTTVYASPKGLLDFDQQSLDLEAKGNKLAPLAGGFLDGVKGTFSYKTEGKSPNRVFTAEWKDWANDYNVEKGEMTFQVKLYETTDVIEYHYKLENEISSKLYINIGIHNDAYPPYIEDDKTDIRYYYSNTWLSDSGEHPVVLNELVYFDQDRNDLRITKFPVSGQTYRFKPQEPKDLTQGQLVINKNGGMKEDGSDGLRVELSGLGVMQMLRKGLFQVFSPFHLDTGTSAPYSGPNVPIGLVIGGDYYNNMNNVIENEAILQSKFIVVSSTPQAEVDAGKPAEIKMTAFRNGYPYYITLKYQNKYPSMDMDMSFKIEIPENNKEEVKFSIGWDTYLDGIDRGPGILKGTAPNYLMGVARGDSYQAFKYEAGEVWSGYYSGSLFDFKTRKGEFNNTIQKWENDDPINGYPDNAMGISLNLGLKPGVYESKNKLIMQCPGAYGKAPVLSADEAKFCKADVNLNSFLAEAVPEGYQLVWLNADGVELTNSEKIMESGVYQAVYMSDAYLCPSPSASINIIIDTSSNCVCTKPGMKGETKHSMIGITTLDRGRDWLEEKPGGILTLESSTEGFVITRVSSPDAINKPVEGMIIYDMSQRCLRLYNGTEWGGCIMQNCVDYR